MTLNSGFIYERCFATESREIRRISNIKATNARMTQGTNEIAIGSLLLQSLAPENQGSVGFSMAKAVVVAPRGVWRRAIDWIRRILRGRGIY